MMQAALYIFWTGVLLVGYTYVGYGVVVLILSKLKKPYPIPTVGEESRLPDVTFLIAAYNEESLIAAKIRNTHALDYPADKLQIFVVTDGCTDKTPDVVRSFGEVTLYHQAERKGKIHAVNRVMKFVSTPITVYSDANTDVNPDALKNIVRHYNSEEVGGVAGEKMIAKNDVDNASGSGEGLYWKYESFLKKKDSDLYSVVGAAGELFSIRTKLYEEPALDMIIEDFFMSLRITMHGYRFIYEPAAIALENASASVSEEWKRKVRIAAGGFQAMGRLMPLLNIFRYGLLSFQYISHRVLRWTLAPLFLPLIFISNIWLAVQGILIYQIFLAGQIAFYSLAVLGRIYQDKKIAIKGFFVPYYFSVMNMAVYYGFVRFVMGKQSVMWERAARADSVVK